jgi:hypothetical protein
VVLKGLGDRLTTGPLSVPVAIHVVLRAHGNDVRFGFAADQMIFNWEMKPTELRIDGGPANGQHKPGAGRLPDGQWARIEWVVKPDEMVVYVDGQERDRVAADFSWVHRPFSVYAENGSVEIRSVEAVRP